MDLVTDKLESARLLEEVFRLKAFPLPVFDLILDDNSFVPDVVALGQRAVGVVVGGHTGFLSFADVPAVANRKVARRYQFLEPMPPRLLARGCGAVGRKELGRCLALFRGYLSYESRNLTEPFFCSEPGDNGSTSCRVPFAPVR